MKIITKPRDGAAQLYVIAVLVLVSVFSAMILRNLQSDIYQMDAYALQMKAYYLADEAASAAVSALLADDDASLLLTGRFPMEDRLEHRAGGEVIGTSEIRMTKEIHPYYGEMLEWVVLRIETVIPDPRPGRDGAPFTYVLDVMVLVDNPLVQIYNMDPDSI